MDQYSIGAVQAFWDGTAPDQGGTALGLMGDSRIVALRAAYQRRSGVVLWVTGYGRVTWDEVRWDTAGERVTG